MLILNSREGMKFFSGISNSLKWRGGNIRSSTVDKRHSTIWQAKFFVSLVETEDPESN